MTLAGIITATVAILGQVTGIANVHAYIRWSADDATFKSLFVSGSKVHAWEVTREATPEAVDYAGSSLDTHVMVIHGYYSLDDSANSEGTFQALIEAIRDKFQQYRQLTVDGTSNAHGISRIKVRPMDHRMLHGVLCHHAELFFEAQAFVGDPQALDLDTTP